MHRACRACLLSAERGKGVCDGCPVYAFLVARKDYFYFLMIGSGFLVGFCAAVFLV